MGRVYIPALRPYYLAVKLQREMRNAILKRKIPHQMYIDAIAQMEMYVDIGFFYIAKLLIRDLAELSGSSEAITMAKELMYFTDQDAEKFFNHYVEQEG